MVHVSKRLAERGIHIPPSDIDRLARSCHADTAIVLSHLTQCNRVTDGSNGDLVILIVRECRPVTIMFRRSNQPLTPCALRVDEIIDRSM